MMETYFLGVDLGSSYTKFVVVDADATLHYKAVLPTLSRRRKALTDTLADIQQRFHISRSCATGYGRNHFDSDVKKTEIICASAGASIPDAGQKCVIDIGGEDIKIIESGPSGEVVNFYMNDKCAAGTGAFITEIAGKAELEIAEMSDLAQQSHSSRVLNSFCTVFAKTEILRWKFDGMPVEDMARGIYFSIVNRICKLPVPTDIPIFLCGGVITYHPYLQDLLAEKLGVPVRITPNPQYVIALGAAVMADRQGAAQPQRSTC
jgi:predicted CoA-substrate-specific enzyme activase